MAEEIDYDGMATQYEYDIDGNLARIIEPTGNWKQMEYDTRHELLYTLHIYAVQNGIAEIVSQSLFFDEVQGMEVVFSDDGFVNEHNK